MKGNDFPQSHMEIYMDTGNGFSDGIEMTSLFVKPEDVRGALVVYGIDANAFNLSSDTCSGMLNYIRRGKMDSTYNTEARVGFIKDNLETFNGRIVEYRGTRRKVTALRIKPIGKLGNDKKNNGEGECGDMQACIRKLNASKKSVWVDTNKLTII